MSRFRFASLLVPAVLTLSGCAVYEFDLTRPEDLAGRAGREEALVRKIEPIEYRLISVENRLVVKMFNTSDQAIKLLAPESTVVDPDGQSRSIKAASIQPGSFARVVMPPVRPEFRSSSGSTARVGTYYGPGLRRSDFGHTEMDIPENYQLVDGGETFWEWRGETEARLVLVYERDGERFTHRLTLNRVKVK
jgi:hypothetical protein